MLSLILFLFSACNRNQMEEKSENYPESGDQVGVENTESRCHFASFELTFPDAWNGRGNTTRLYTPAHGTDRFALAGEAADWQEEASSALALFYSTEFYGNSAVFSVTQERTVNGAIRVTGLVSNTRTNQTLAFCGYHFSTPDGFFLFFDRSSDTPERIEEAAD